MSMFGTIMSKIFGSDHPAAKPDGGASPSGGAEASSPSASETATTSPRSTAAPAPEKSVDVTAILDGMADNAGQKLDWRHSIVDLMKLLGMDSSLGARKELAHELDYSGDTNDSASMNIWLHKEVMSRFAANGGKLPSDLAHH